MVDKKEPSVGGGREVTEKEGRSQARRPRLREPLPQLQATSYIRVMLTNKASEHSTQSLEKDRVICERYFARYFRQ